VRQKKQPYTQAQINPACDIMPRKAPKEVIEHRITFGDFERKELKDAINSYQQDKILENVPNILMGAAGVVVAGTVAAVGYAVYYWLDSVPSIVETVKDVVGNTQDKVSTAVSKARYARFSTLEEVNAAWDDERDRIQAQIAKAQKTITAFEEGKLGNFTPEWFINGQRQIVANETKTMARIATERADYISRWQEWKASQTN